MSEPFRKMRSFENEAVEYFSTQVPPGHFQRVDGVECFSRLSEYWFWRWRLERLVRRGVLRSKVFGSIWRSCSNLPSYAIATKED